MSVNASSADLTQDQTLREESFFKANKWVYWTTQYVQLSPFRLIRLIQMLSLAHKWRDCNRCSNLCEFHFFSGCTKCSWIKFLTACRGLLADLSEPFKPSLPTILDHHFFYKHTRTELKWKNSMSKTYCVHLKRAISIEIELSGKLSQGSWKWPYICERSVWHFIMYWEILLQKLCSSALSADLWSMSQKVSTCQLWTLIALQWPHIMLKRWLSGTKKYVRISYKSNENRSLCQFCQGQNFYENKTFFTHIVNCIQ